MTANSNPPHAAENTQGAPVACGGEGPYPLLSATEARKFLERRIGTPIRCETFYFWLRTGKIFSFWRNKKILVPRFAIEKASEQCLRGERMSAPAEWALAIAGDGQRRSRPNRGERGEMPLNRKTSAGLKHGATPSAMGRNGSDPTLLSAADAQRMIRRRTGCLVPMNTFYAWLRKRAIYSIRLGERFWIPRFVVEETCERCLRGERLLPVT